MKLKHCISSNDFTKGDIARLFVLADRVRTEDAANRHKNRFSKALKGYTVATYFTEPSTRTKMSFDASIQQLGANFITESNGKENSSAWKGETIEDTARTIEGYNTDMLIMRHHEDDALERVARAVKIPVISAGSGKSEHPTQALLDLYTMRRLKGQTDGLSVAVIGDLKYGRTTHSLAKILAKYDGIKIYGLSVEGLDFPSDYIEYLKRNGTEYIHCNDFEEIPKNIDFLYCTRVQKERFANENNIDSKLKKVVLNKQTLDRFSSQSYVMHPLPRNGELPTEIDADPRAKYFEQARNGLAVRKALLLDMLCKDEI